jgi:dipeptidyl aminopeptidase/acylaminoacyl peptidase
MKVRTVIFLALAALLASDAVNAQRQVATVPVLPEQLVSYSSVAREPLWSRDGERVLYMGSDGLWSIPATGGSATKVTQAGAQTRPSPAGDWIAYVSEKSGAPELYAWSQSGNREVRLTSLGARVGAYSWSPDGRTIAFGGDRYGSMDIWTVTVPDGQVKRLTGDMRYEVYPTWTPDSRTIVFQRMSDSWVDRDWMEIPAAGGTPRRVAEDRGFMDYGQGRDVGYGHVSPDGLSLLVRSQRSGYRAYWIVPRAGGAARAIDKEAIDQADASWSPDGKSIAYVVQKNGTHSLRVVSAAGGTPLTLVEPELGVVSSAEWSPDGTRISYLLATPTQPADLHVVKVSDGTVVRLTNSEGNGAVKSALVVPKKVSYPSADGLTINAYLFEPQGLQPGEKAPGIIYAHGGPTGHWADSYQAQAQWLALNGYAVLAPNIRGSSGYGKRFEDANNGCWGRCDLKDVIAGVEYLKKQPNVNPGKMGMTGNSYGGIITMATVGFAPGLLQAAVPQSGYGDWVKFFEYNNVLQHVKLLAYEFGPFPDSTASYRRASPIFELKNATTPTFIIHGTGATTPWRAGQLEVPAGLDFARELDKHYKIFRYKTYPGEGYYVSGRENSKQVLIDMLAFFNEFLKDGVIDLAPARSTAVSDQDR